MIRGSMEYHRMAIDLNVQGIGMEQTQEELRKEVEIAQRDFGVRPFDYMEVYVDNKKVPPFSYWTTIESLFLAVAKAWDVWSEAKEIVVHHCQLFRIDGKTLIMRNVETYTFKRQVFDEAYDPYKD